jgi:hypothetical protein
MNEGLQIDRPHTRETADAVNTGWLWLRLPWRSDREGGTGRTDKRYYEVFMLATPVLLGGAGGLAA